MKSRLWRNLLVGWAVLAGGVLAQEALPPGNVEDGKKLAMHTEGKVVACFACHGEKVRDQADSAFPRLEGLGEYYIRKQLLDYRQGTRVNAVMQPYAEQMTPQEVADVAAYYGSLSVQLPSPPAGGDAALIERGRVLAEVGDSSQRLQACANCHGPRGMGLPPAIPSLAGQPASYLVAQIEAWKKGTRKNDEGGLMAAVAEKLDATDTAAVAEYYARVRPARFEP